MDMTAYTTTKETLGFYDATNAAGRVLALGPDALDLLHRMSTNDLRPLFGNPGKGAQTVLTSDKGRIIDLLTVIVRKSDTLLTISAGREELVIKWLDKFVIMENASFVSATNAIAQFGIYGPRSMDLLKQYTSENLMTMTPLSSVTIEIAGAEVLMQKVTRIAESGWSLFVQTDDSEKVKQALQSDVLAMHGAILDDQTFELLRIEAGIPAAPNEINEKHNPLETTLVSAVSFTKGCYIGQEVIARLDSYDKVQRHMLGIILDGVSATSLEALSSEISGSEQPAVTLKLETAAGDVVGELTSFIDAPTLNGAMHERVIGLAFIRTAHANPGLRLNLRATADKIFSAELVKLPFESSLA